MIAQAPTPHTPSKGPSGGGGKPSGGKRPAAKKPQGKPAAKKPQGKPAPRKPQAKKPQGKKTAGRGDLDLIWFDDTEFAPMAKGGHIH